MSVSVQTVRKMLKRECEKHGSQTACAKRLGISIPHLNKVLHGNQDPYESVLSYFGLERVITIQRKRG